MEVQKKAYAINQDDKPYGVFAEIGAGQEVVRHFFKSSLSSRTIAKAISAYDMVVSDEIYGSCQRYVSFERLNRILEKEYSLLAKRLSSEKQEKQFFVFANTVTTQTRSRGKSHGWVGLRFQHEPKAPFSEVVLHTKLFDKSQQQKVVGILGVNLIYATFYKRKNIDDFFSSLREGLEKQLCVDHITFNGPAFSSFDDRAANIALVIHGFARSVCFDPQAVPVQIDDVVFGRPILLMPGVFRPITKINLDILKKGKEHCKRFLKKDDPVFPILEISMCTKENKTVDRRDLINRIETIAATGHHTMLSNFTLLHESKQYLQESTDHFIFLIVGSILLETIFDSNYYIHLSGGALESFGKLFDDKTKILIFPYKKNDLCYNSKSFYPQKDILHLYKYLLENEKIVDIVDCESIDFSISSEELRQLFKEKSSKWKDLVPSNIVELIESKKMFMN